MAVKLQLLALFAVAALAAAQGPAAAPGPAGPGLTSDCLTALGNMSDCLPYVQSGSTTRRPDKACCPELAGLVDSKPVCLCQLLAGGAESYGIAIDFARALALPGVCHVTIPPVSTCAALGYPVHLGPSPAPSPGASLAPFSGVPPVGEGPQLPGSSPAASPPKGANHAAGRFTAGGLVSLAALPVAVAAAGMF